MDRSLGVGVAAAPATVGWLEDALPSLGHSLAFVVSRLEELRGRCLAAPPDLAVLEARLPDGDGLECAGRLCREQPLPTLILLPAPSAEALARVPVEQGAGCLVLPASAAQLAAEVALAIRRFEGLVAQAVEAAGLRQALEERKLVERAKGVVTRRLGVSEEDAYNRLRRLASERNWRLADLARTLPTADEPFHLLETQTGSTTSQQFTAIPDRRSTAGGLLTTIRAGDSCRSAICALCQRTFEQFFVAVTLCDGPTVVGEVCPRCLSEPLGSALGRARQQAAALLARARETVGRSRKLAEQVRRDAEQRQRDREGRRRDREGRNRDLAEPRDGDGTPPVRELEERAVRLAGLADRLAMLGRWTVTLDEVREAEKTSLREHFPGLGEEDLSRLVDGRYRKLLAQPA